MIETGHVLAYCFSRSLYLINIGSLLLKLSLIKNDHFNTKGLKLEAPNMANAKIAKISTRN